MARQVLSFKALAYYESAADDEISECLFPCCPAVLTGVAALSENARAFTRFFFHPRVMRSVARCDPKTTILGFPSSVPVFVSGAALAKLGHPLGVSLQSPGVLRILTDILGEANIAQAAATTGITYMVSSNASLSAEEIAAAAKPPPTLFFQLYKHSKDDVALARIRNVERLGYRAIWLTVDAIVAGNRERDIRVPWALEAIERKEQSDQPPGVYDAQKAEEEDAEVELGGTAGALVANDDRDMTWEKVSKPRPDREADTHPGLGQRDHSMAARCHQAPDSDQRCANTPHSN